MNSVMHIYHTIDQKENQKETNRQTNQQGQENGYQMTKGPNLHHAQQSLTHAIAMSVLTFVELCIRWVKLYLAPIGCFCLQFSFWFSF